MRVAAKTEWQILFRFKGIMHQELYKTFRNGCELRIVGLNCVILISREGIPATLLLADHFPICHFEPLPYQLILRSIASKTLKSKPAPTNQATSRML